MELSPVQVYRDNGLTSLPLQQPYFMYNRGGYIDPDAERYGFGGILKQFAPTLAGFAVGIPFGNFAGAAAGALTGFGLGGFDNIMDAVSGGLGGYAGGSMGNALVGLGSTAATTAGTGAQQAAQFASQAGMAPGIFGTPAGALMPGTGGVVAGPGLADFGASLGRGSLPASTSSFLPSSASEAVSSTSSPFLNYGPQSGGVPGGLEQNIWNPALSPDTGGGFGEPYAQALEGAGKAFNPFGPSFDEQIASGSLTEGQVEAYKLAQKKSLGASAAAMSLAPMQEQKEQPGIGVTEADMSGLTEEEKLKIQQRLTAGKTFQPPNLSKYETGASPYGGVFGAQEGGRVPEGGLKEIEEINRFGNWLKENEASGWESSDDLIDFDNGGLAELPYPSAPGPDNYDDYGFSLAPDDYGFRGSYTKEGFPTYNSEDPYDAFVHYNNTPIGDIDVDVIYEELSKIKDSEVRANVLKEIFPNIEFNLDAGHDFGSGESDIHGQFTMPFSYQAGGVTTPPQMNPQAMQHLKQEADKGVPWAVELSQKLTPTRGRQRGQLQYENGGEVWDEQQRQVDEWFNAKDADALPKEVPTLWPDQRNDIAREIAAAEGTVIPEHMLEEPYMHGARRRLDRAAIDYGIPRTTTEIMRDIFDAEKDIPQRLTPFGDITRQNKHTGYWEPHQVGLQEGGLVLEGGSFVIPADVVSGVGDGSSEEGHDILTRMFNMNESNMAAGGLLKGPIQGAGGGLDDLIQTSIDGVRSARVSNDEFVVPSAIVNQLGGPEKLYDLMKNIRQQRTGSTEQPQPVNMSNYMTA